jgi:hypothetical protein
MIDSFNFREHRGYSIKENQKNLKKWDIPEDKGMVKCDGVLVVDRGFRDRILQNKIQCIIQTCVVFIDALKTSLNCHLDKIDPKYKSGAKLFVITPHTVQEMCPNKTFDGLNKPKDIVEQDTNIRAGRKHVMLTVFHDGKLKKWKEFKELLIHELSHTLCNHVTYRVAGNHSDDFHNYERFLTYFIDNCPDVVNAAKALELCFR